MMVNRFHDGPSLRKTMLIRSLLEGELKEDEVGRLKAPRCLDNLGKSI